MSKEPKVNPHPTHHTGRFKALMVLVNMCELLVVDDIISIFKRYSKVLLGSPTGTGKSTFTKEDLTKHYKNMIIIASLKKIARGIIREQKYKYNLYRE